MPENKPGSFTANHIPPMRDPSKHVTGVVEIMGETQLPKEFITVGRDFDDALGRTMLLDDNQLNDVIFYVSKLREFGMIDEEKDLISWLNGRPAVGGYQRMQAIMAHIGVAIPEWGGVKLSKEGMKALREMQEKKAKSNQQQDQAPG